MIYYELRAERIYKYIFTIDHLVTSEFLFEYEKGSIDFIPRPSKPITPTREYTLALVIIPIFIMTTCSVMKCTIIQLVYDDIES